MKTSAILLFAAAALLTAPLPCQKSQEQLLAQRAKKLAKPVFTYADWNLDYEKAQEIARSEGKLILAYFTRSFSP